MWTAGENIQVSNLAVATSGTSFNNFAIVVSVAGNVTTVFSPTEYSFVGLNEQEAIKEFGDENVEVQEEDTITKREILECSDGRKAFDGPSYWELFAQFYYVDVNTPEYCRYYSREGHAFKTPGKVCLQVNGEWEVR